MRRIALHRVGLLIVLAFGLYALLLAGSLYSGVTLALDQAVAQVSVGMMTAAGGGEILRQVELERSGGEVVYHERISIEAEVRELAFRHPLHSQNLLLITALMLSTPGLAWRQRAAGLGVGLAAIFVLDVVICAGDIWQAERKGAQLDARPGMTGPLSDLGMLLRFMHPTGGAFMAPVFVWLLAVLGPWRSAVIEALAPATPVPAR